MIKIPDEPDKYIYYCVVLLPGFLILGTVLHVTEHALSEFAFTYIAVTLSLLVYVLVDALVALCRWLAHRATRLRSASRVPPPSDRLVDAEILSKVSRAVPFPVALLATGLVSVAVAGIIVTATTSDSLLSSLRSFKPLRIDRVSASEPLLYLLRHERQLHDIDSRPVSSRMDQRTDSKGDCVGAPYSAYARVTVDGKVYEGRVSHFNGQPGKQGFPLLLSPACIVTPGANESFAALHGPGVIVFGEDLRAVELREMYASGCWHLFNPKAPPAGRCRTP